MQYEQIENSKSKFINANDMKMIVHKTAEINLMTYKLY